MNERSQLDVTEAGTGLDEEKEADEENADKKKNAKFNAVNSIKKHLEDVRRNGGKFEEDKGDERPKYDITTD